MMNLLADVKFLEKVPFTGRAGQLECVVCSNKTSILLKF